MAGETEKEIQRGRYKRRESKIQGERLREKERAKLQMQREIEIDRQKERCKRIRQREGDRKGDSKKIHTEAQ